MVLAHGGTAGLVAEAAFLAIPVVVFLVLSRLSKRRAAELAEQEAEHEAEQQPGRASGPEVRREDGDPGLHLDGEGG